MQNRVLASAGVAGVVCSLIALPLQANDAAPARPHNPAVRHQLPPSTGRLHRRSRFVAGGATGCTSDYGTTGEYFIGASDPSFPNYADSLQSGVVAGMSNEACDLYSVIGGGGNNVIGAGNGGNASDSFIAAGSSNGISINESFIGAGEQNGVSGPFSFVGAGYEGLAAGYSSFVGAGGYAYLSANPDPKPGMGNIAGAGDSFVGAGDLNQITMNGNGSFIGAGGYMFAMGGNSFAGNEISGADSFVGAGDQNYVATNNAFIGAGTANEVLSSASYSVVAGGEGNTSSGPDSFLGAGTENTATSSANYSVVTGGYGNTMSAADSFIGAGAQNSATSSARYSVVAGGYGNTMTGQKGALGGGEANRVAGSFATVPGGYHDEALGNESFAAGSQAEAKYAGSFVWSDYVSTEKPQTDSAINEFVARASGGVYFFSNATSSAGVHLASGSGTWSSLSDRNAKTHIVPLDDDAILAKVAALPVSAWQYKTERGVTHVGPMAQDFYAAFGTGDDDRHITSIDEDGVALAAIKALRADDERRDAADKRKDADITALRADLRRLEAIVVGLRRR